MASIKATTKHYSGKLYWMDNLEVNDQSDLKKILQAAIIEDEAPYVLSECTIIKSRAFEGDKIIFDLNVEGFFEQNFIGFLYPDGKILGKFKWSRHANLPDEIFNGRYATAAKGSIILCGVWDDNRGKYHTVIELKSINKSIEKKLR